LALAWAELRQDELMAKLDYEKFRRVRVSFDTIEWDEGVDLDPEFVYKKSKPIYRTQ
jgi:hypothetical protein